MINELDAQQACMRAFMQVLYDQGWYAAGML